MNIAQYKAGVIPRKGVVGEEDLDSESPTTA